MQIDGVPDLRRLGGDVNRACVYPDERKKDF